MAKIESQQRVDIRPVIGGTLKKICVSEGALVKKGQPLFVIDQAPYIAAVDAAKAQVATAKTALATAQLNEELPQKGRFDAISGSAEFTMGTVIIRASFNDPSELFRNGSNGYIYLPTIKKDVYVIPQDATTHIQDKYFVYRVVEGKAVSTEVEALPANDHQHYVVTSGLNDGDVIIAENAGMVSEGYLCHVIDDFACL